MGDSLRVALLLDGSLNLLAILAQGNLVHNSTSHRMMRCCWVQGLAVLPVKLVRIIQYLAQKSIQMMPVS